MDDDKQETSQDKQEKSVHEDSEDALGTDQDMAALMTSLGDSVMAMTAAMESMRSDMESRLAALQRSTDMRGNMGVDKTPPPPDRNSGISGINDLFD